MAKNQAAAKPTRASRQRAARPASTPGRRRLSRARAAFAKQLVAECGGRPLGPTLTVLLEVAPYTDHFGLFADDMEHFADATRTYRKDLATENGIIALGRASQKHFGVMASRLGATIDASPVAWVDRHGGDPAVVAADLATFVRIVHFVPDLLLLDDLTAAAADRAHAELFDGLSANERAAWDKLATIPGAHALASGAELVDLVAAAPDLPFPRPWQLGEDREARLTELFRAHVGDSKLLIDIESLTIRRDEVDVEIGVNASRDRLKRVVAHRVVHEPLTRFLDEARAALAASVTLRYTPVPPEDRRERDRSLRLALELAGAPDLIETLGLARRDP